ncbi:MAG: NAD(P)H-dependent oxidoreductase subunit E, partial [Desulfotignum sp.]
MHDHALAEQSDALRLRSLDDLNRFRKQILDKRDPDQLEIVVCHGTGCLANGSADVSAAIRSALDESGIDAKVVPGIKTTGCQGFCSHGPLVVIRPQGIFYQKVKPKDAKEIIEKTIVQGDVVKRLLYKNPTDGEKILHEQDIPFYKRQTRVVLHNIGKIDPTDISDTIASGGYQGLAKALTTMTPEQVVQEIETSGLRGRGGAGFPTGRKWRSALTAIEKKGRPVYVVVNGDEGDPGAFMDRTIMEGDPHAVLEGLILGAYALGANQGYLYVRAEYPLAIK